VFIGEIVNICAREHGDDVTRATQRNCDDGPGNAELCQQANYCDETEKPGK